MKGKKLEGLKFRRQQPIHKYVADFYCADRKLVVELDGVSHNFLSIYENDVKKEKALFDLGFTVVRFADEDVKNNIEGVLTDIKKAAGIL
ncbi:MAG: DUF559 domain-containing protein [Alphaproteobacteria bacterium]|nr:MAG: DUF559 domain-containing protein [Alphaproteobacteria bacterium]